MQPSINTKSIISPKCSFLQYTNPEKKKRWKNLICIGSPSSSSKWAPRSH